MFATRNDLRANKLTRVSPALVRMGWLWAIGQSARAQTAMKDFNIAMDPQVDLKVLFLKLGQ